MKTLRTPQLVLFFIFMSSLFMQASVDETGDPIKIVRKKYALHLFTQNKIKFELNSTKLSSCSKYELGKIASTLKNNPNVKIQINVYNDARSAIDFSKEITQKRAEVIKTFFINCGINANNLVAIGRGDSNILNKCKAFVKCTNAEHEVNRRVELKILNPEGIDNYVLVKKSKRTLALK